MNFSESSKKSGEFYGYPKCCIDEFILNRPGGVVPKYGHAKIRLRAAHINGVYSGFIPCLKHAKEILTGKITLESLIQNRDITARPFPDDWSHI